MSLQRFQYSPPCKMNGLEDSATEDQVPLALEVIRRVETRFTTLETAIRNQIPTDSDILPEQVAGASDAATHSIATTQDVEDSQLDALIWNM